MSSNMGRPVDVVENFIENYWSSLEKKNMGQRPQSVGRSVNLSFDNYDHTIEKKRNITIKQRRDRPYNIRDAFQSSIKIE